MIKFSDILMFLIGFFVVYRYENMNIPLRSARNGWNFSISWIQVAGWTLNPNSQQRCKDTLALTHRHHARSFFTFDDRNVSESPMTELSHWKLN